MKKLLLLTMTCLCFYIVPLMAYEGEEYFPKDTGPYMGDWKGLWLDGGKQEKKFPDIAAQVVATGKGTYMIRLVPTLFERCPPFGIVKAEEKAGKLVIIDEKFHGEISNGIFKGGKGKDGKAVFKMKKITRVSPTLGAKPPENAIVLFDGKGFDQWTMGSKPVNWILVEGKAMQTTMKSKSLQTKQKFTDVQLHVEFRTPFLPEKTGQARGNSGVHLQDSYEVQVLDCYGLDGYWNECGALYKINAPYVNMCLPPLQWQTYDITFYAARFDKKGDKIKDPTITVVHNGITIHREEPLVRKSSETKMRPVKPKTDPGSIKLSYHNNYIQYKNVWIIDLSKE